MLRMLVVNIYTDRYYAMKVTNQLAWERSRYGRVNETRILEILHDTRGAVGFHTGRRSIPELLDRFIVSGPMSSSSSVPVSTDKHFCLVLEVMGEPMIKFASRFDLRKILTVLVKRILKQLLRAIELAHVTGVVHTGTFTEPYS